MSEFRRTLLMNVADKQEYIQDGLIFELDGTDKRAEGNYVWVDKIGGIKFTNDGNVTSIDNGFHFNGTSYSILSGTTVTPHHNPLTCTMEFVLKSNVESGNWGPVAVFQDWSSGKYLGTSVNRQSIVNYKNTIVATYRGSVADLTGYIIPENSLLTISLVVNTPPYVNKTLCTNVSATNIGAFSSDGTSHIGGRVAGSNRVAFNGDIYAVRLYDRVLTVDEMLHNQTIDIQRYNIQL